MHSLWKVCSDAMGWRYDPADIGNLQPDHLVAAAVVRECSVAILVGHTDNAGDFYLLDSAKVEIASAPSRAAAARLTQEALLTCWSRIGVRLTSSVGRFLLCLPAAGMRCEEVRSLVKIVHRRFVPGFHRARIRGHHIEKAEDGLLAEHGKAGRVPCDMLGHVFLLNDGRVTADPLGEESTFVELRADAITSDSDWTEAILAGLKEMGIRPISLTSPYGAVAGIVTEREKRYGVMVVDVGSHEVCCSTYHGAGLVHAVSESWDANDVARQVGGELGVWPGYVESFVAENKDRLQLPECDGATRFPLNRTAGVRTVSFDELIEAARQPVAALRDLVSRELGWAKGKGMDVTKVILVGDDFLALSALRRQLAGGACGVECEWRQLGIAHRPSSLSASEWARAIGLVRQSAGSLRPHMYLRRANESAIDRCNRILRRAPISVGEWCILSVRAALRAWRSRRHTRAQFEGLRLDHRVIRGAVSRFSLF